MKLLPIILAGGSGSRLWPMSRESLPKQFLRLTGPYSLFQQTILRAQTVTQSEEFIIVSNIQHHFLCLEHLHEINIKSAKFILEPCLRNTAPAIACAAFYAQELYDSSIKLLVMPSDHLLQNQEAFNQAIGEAAEVATDDWLVTFGIKPFRPETGYGYIEIDDNKIGKTFRTKRFIEKPNEELAKQFIARNEFYWNSGMFLFKATTYLQELSNLNSVMYKFSREAFQQGKKTNDSIVLDEDSFKQCPNNSIDCAVMEKTNKIVLLPLISEWDDLGNWLAVANTSIEDENHNVLQGDVIAREASGCFIRAEDHFVAAIGVKDQIIVSTADALLVADKRYSQQVRQIVDQLKLDQKTLATHHKKINYDWGFFEILLESDLLQLKLVSLNANKKIHLSKNNFFAYWIHINGEGEIVNSKHKIKFRDHLAFSLETNERPVLLNIGHEPLNLLELQFCTKKLIPDTENIFEKTYI